MERVLLICWIEGDLAPVTCSPGDLVPGRVLVPATLWRPRDIPADPKACLLALPEVCLELVGDPRYMVIGFILRPLIWLSRPAILGPFHGTRIVISESF